MSNELAKRGIGVFGRSFTRRMILALSLVGACVCVAPTTFGQDMQFEPDTDRYGSDYNSFSVTGGAESCRDACAKDPKCQAFTYRVDSPYCWLKNPAPNPSHQPGLISGVKGPGTGGGGSLNFLQNALILGVQTGFVKSVTSNPKPNLSFLSQVVPMMPSYAAALGLPHDQLDILIGQLQSGAPAGVTIDNVWNQFQQQLTNRTCMCGNYAANLKTAYDAGFSLGIAEMEAFLGSPGDSLIPLVSGARVGAAAVGLPTDGLDSVISRLQSGAKGCDVAQDLQNIEKQFEQLTNQPCTCMQDANASSGSQTNPPAPGPMPPQPQPQGPGTCERMIYQNPGTIFGASVGKPLVVRPPGGLQARVVHLEVPANTFLNLDAVMVFDSSGTNVALNKPARQSSNSPWTQPNGAQGGVDGHKPDGGYHIHTNLNGNPSWWEVDLQQVYTISEIRVYNRTDIPDRAKYLKICVNYQPSSNAGGTMNPSGTATNPPPTTPGVSLAGTKWVGQWIIYPWVDSTGKSTLTINPDGTATTSAKSGDGRSTYSAQWWGCVVTGDQLKCKFNEHLAQPNKSADRTGTVTCTSSWGAQAGGWYLKADYAFDTPPDPATSATFWRFPLGG